MRYRGSMGGVVWSESRYTVFAFQVVEVIREPRLGTGSLMSEPSRPLVVPSAQRCGATNSLKLIRVGVDVKMLDFSHPEVERERLNEAAHVEDRGRENRPDQHDLQHQKTVDDDQPWLHRAHIKRDSMCVVA